MTIEYEQDYLRQLYEDGRRIPTHPGEVIKEELEVRGISQKLFSENTGIAYSTLNEMLNGHRPMTSDHALIIEAALGISAEMLVAMQTRRVASECKGILPPPPATSCKLSVYEQYFWLGTIVSGLVVHCINLLSNSIL